MRGNPILNLVLVIGCLGAFAAAIAALTGNRPTTKLGVVADSNPGTTACAATLKFAHPPLTASLHHLGSPVWETTAGSTTTFEIELGLPDDIATHGIDLQLTATWPPGTPETVAQLSLHPDSLETTTSTTWAQGGLDEILTFTWPQPPQEENP